MKNPKIWRRVTLGVILLLAFGAGFQVLAPYHNPPAPAPPPPPSQPPNQEQNLSTSSAIILIATLTASQEVPTPSASTRATVIGAAVFHYHIASQTLSFSIAYKDLSGPLTFSHFHNGQSGVAGGVVQTICGTPGAPLISNCSTDTSGFLTGVWQVPQNLITTLLQGQLYVNIHTSLNGSGEIRGQVIPL